MSAANSIARGAREPSVPVEPAGLDIPPELEARYQIRLVEAAGNEQRIGLFRAGDRHTPAIEITADRIVARREDAETVDSLVRIAQYNGWDRIAVDGSPEFRKAIWAAATREGLAVSGYEPSFAEQEQLATSRRRNAAGAVQQPAEQAAPARIDPEPLPPVRSGRPADASEDRSSSDTQLSDADSRLLLKVSALTEDRKSLYGTLREDLGTLEREVLYERIDDNRGALGAALERALESPTVVSAFARTGYEPDALRTFGRGGEWDTEVADAIYLARSGRHRDTLPVEPGARTILENEVDVEGLNRGAAGAPPPAGQDSNLEPVLVRGEQERHPVTERRHERDELAELFLHGASERLEADPRLAGAMQAQTVMEQHIGEVFGGDATRMASANLESRQLISDALRRGLDVSVREPTPVRQIEPIQAHVELER